MSKPLVECRGVTKRFGDVVAVEDVAFALMPGEVVSILGASGCGKTTLLRLIAGFDAVDAGEILLQSDLASSVEYHMPPELRRMGMVFQEYALFPHLTVAQNVSFGLRESARSERSRMTDDALELVRLTGLEGRYPHELSGGQQQRVALARTLAPSPIAVLLDEPFSNLDASMRHDMRREVAAILRANGTAALFVTHDREEAFAFADRVGVMNDGRLAQLEEPDVLYQFPVSPSVARIVGDCEFIPGTVRGDYADTEIGWLPYRLPGGQASDGTELLLMLRPHDITVKSDESGNCAVVSLEYRGGETMLTVRTPKSVSLRCRQTGFSALKKDSRVSLSARDSAPFWAFANQ